MLQVEISRAASAPKPSSTVSIAPATDLAHLQSDEVWSDRASQESPRFVTSLTAEEPSLAYDRGRRLV